MKAQPASMMALNFDGRSCTVQDRAVPIRKRDEALIRVRVAGVCNTDLEIVQGYKGFAGVLGHEFVGVVVDSDDTEWIGRRVCAEINVSCGHCRFCSSDMRSHCISRRVLGMLEHDGAFAEFVTAPIDNLHCVPDMVPDDEAVYVEPLAAAFQILEQVQIGPRDRTVVLGDGKLGLLCAQVLATTGADLILCGRHENKLLLARHRGIRTAFSPEIVTGWADMAVDATGQPDGIEEAIRMLRPRGTLVLKTTTAHPAPVDLSALVVNEISVLGSRCGPFARAMDALQCGSVDVQSLTSARYPLSDGIQALTHAAQKGVLKVLIDVGAAAQAS